jgi:CheY-like chemotaxis protein
LGLATVFGIVQQHQGWINVQSEVGRGTTFRVYLPRLGEPAEKGIIQPALPAVVNGSETILLVEDEVPLRQALRNTLTRFGYRVLEAGTGAEALQVWESHRGEIRLLLTDLMMPGGMNGKELAAQLLRHEPRLKAIYTSGYGGKAVDKDFCLEEGVNYLHKPFDMYKLAEVVRNCLDNPVPPGPAR